MISKLYIVEYRQFEMWRGFNLIEFIDKATGVTGTPINRANMMGMQGFQAQTTTFNADGSITETNGLGHTKTSGI